MLLKSAYYSLAEAAAIAKCTEKYLIHLGVLGKLAIYTVTNKQWEFGGIVPSFDELDAEEEKICLLEPQLLPIDWQSLFDYEAYPDTTEVFAFACHIGEKRAIAIYKTSDQQPIKLKDCYLVVRSDDLDEFLKNDASNSTLPDDQSMTELAETENLSSPMASAITGRDRQKMNTKEKHNRYIAHASAIKAKHPNWSISQISRQVVLNLNVGGEKVSDSTVRNVIMNAI